MEAEELRIGNLAQDKNGKILTVIGTREGEDTRFESKDGHYTYPVTPIKLTDKVLDKLGFKEIDTNDDGGDHFYYNREFDLGLDRSYQPFGGWQTFYELQFVHELQNLFRFTTGKELQIK